MLNQQKWCFVIEHDKDVEPMQVPTNEENRPNTSAHISVRKHICEKFREVFGIECPWDASEGRALREMMFNNRWTVEQWQSMVSNRFASEGITGDRPRVWLRHMSRWAAGPLNKYGKTELLNAKSQRNTARDFEPQWPKSPKPESAKCVVCSEQTPGEESLCSKSSCREYFALVMSKNSKASAAGAKG